MFTLIILIIFLVFNILLLSILFLYVFVGCFSAVSVVGLRSVVLAY